MAAFSSIDDAVAVLARCDPALADDAAHAAHWIVGGTDVDETDALTLAGVQRFLWYELPLKWMMPDEERPRIVGALMELCALLDRPLLVEACRSSTTAEVLSAYERSDEDGLRAFRTAMKSSLVEVVDTDRLSWGSISGLDEARARHVVESALEEALATGRVVRGRQGWKVAQRSVVDEALEGPHPELPGQSWLSVIVTERVGTWVDGLGRSPALSRMRGAVANELLHPIAVPADAAAVLEPLLWFCDEHCQGGIPLTQKGLLGQKFVQRAAAERGWWDFHGAPRTETDVWQLHELHGLVRATRLAQRERGHLMPTVAGIGSRAKPGETWRRVAEHLGGRADFDKAAFEACVLGVVTAAGPVSWRHVEDEAAEALAAVGWMTQPRDGPPKPPDRFRVGQAAAVGMRRLRLFSALDEGDDWRDRQVALTHGGRALVRAWLRALAAGPRHGFV